MIPDSMLIKLFELNDIMLDLACDGDEYGLSSAQMDRFNSINDDLSDLLAELGPAEQE